MDETVDLLDFHEELSHRLQTGLELHSDVGAVLAHFERNASRFVLLIPFIDDFVEGFLSFEQVFFLEVRVNQPADHLAEDKSEYEASHRSENREHGDGFVQAGNQDEHSDKEEDEAGDDDAEVASELRGERRDPKRRLVEFVEQLGQLVDGNLIVHEVLVVVVQVIRSMADGLEGAEVELPREVELWSIQATLL